MVNISGLAIELALAGISIGGCNIYGVVWDQDNNEIQTRSDVAAVIAAHDQASWDLKESQWRTLRGGARTTVKNIPNWATWTYAEFEMWCGDNLMTDAAIDGTTLSAALKTNIKAMNTFIRNAGKMEIALRNNVWPDLSDVP